MRSQKRLSPSQRILLSVLDGRWPTLLGFLLMIAVALGALWWGIERTLSEKQEAARALIVQQAVSRTASYAYQLEDLTSRLDSVADHIVRRWQASPGDVHLDDIVTGLLSKGAGLFVFILDADGQVTSASFPTEARSIPDLDFFRDLRAGCCPGWQVTPPSFGPVVGTEVVRFSRRLNKPDGSFGGALVFASLPGVLSAFQDNSVIGPRDFVTVRLLDGPVLTTKMGPGQPKRIFYLQNPKFPGERGVLREDGSKFKDGFTRWVAWQKHPSLPLVALSAIAEQDALTDFQQTAESYRYVAALATGALLLLGAMVVFAALAVGARQAAADEVRRTYRMATDAANEGFYMLRPEFNASGALRDLLVEDCNDRGAGLFGTTRDGLLGMRLGSVLTPEMHTRLLDTCERAMRFGSVEDELRMPADSQINASWIYRRAVFAGAGIALTLRDISELKAHEEELNRLANHDALTGLPNRHWLTHQLPLAIERAQRARSRLALLFIDLDNFKLVNDTLGHDAGDALLVEAAMRIRGAVRASDAVARLGGDEFTVLLENVEDPQTVDQIAHKILQALAAPFPALQGLSGAFSASVGASLYPDDAASAEGLLKHADIAMYASKSAGKGRLSHYETAMSDALLAEAGSDSQGVKPGS